MPDVTSTLQEILADHGVNLLPTPDGWLTTGGNYPVCRASTDEPKPLPGGCKLRLDIELALSETRLLIESFSDLGADPNAAFQAVLQNFCSGSLHVLLSALWGVTDDEQVFVETYAIGKQNWTMHLGNLVRKAAGGIEVPPPHDFMSIFDRLIQQLELSPTIHWGRIYYANLAPSPSIVEVLLDNEPWLAGDQALRNAAWPRLESFYSTRLFWMLVPQR